MSEGWQGRAWRASQLPEQRHRHDTSTRSLIHSAAATWLPGATRHLSPDTSNHTLTPWTSSPHPPHENDEEEEEDRKGHLYTGISCFHGSRKDVCVWKVGKLDATMLFLPHTDTLDSFTLTPTRDKGKRTRGINVTLEYFVFLGEGADVCVWKV